MRLGVRLFAVLREHAGTDRVEIELDRGATVADALEALRAESSLGEVLERLPVRIAVNLEYADPATQLSAGDELAAIPPVSGGAAPSVDRAGRGPHRGPPARGDSAGCGVYARVHDEPLDPGALSRSVRRPGAGAVVSFQGTTRDVERLEYEAYTEMAERRIAEILRDCVERHRLEAAAAEHRVGSVPLGEASVVVAVSAAHREEAFAGAREAIDRIKAEAPIWKREVERDGTSPWVEGELPPLDRDGHRPGPPR